MSIGSQGIAYFLTTCSVNEVVPRGKAIETAISWALKICDSSPDSVQATKHGLILGQLRGGVEEAFASHTWGEVSKNAWTGENFKVGRICINQIYQCSLRAQEGLRAFVEVRGCLLYKINILTR